MARETKEQRALRDAREQQILEDEKQEYLKTVPARLAAADVLARSLGISTTITLTEGGPSVHFYDSSTNFDAFATYQIDQWELEWIETKLADLKEEQDARAARRKLAEDAWALLSSGERFAIKENIHYLRA